MTKTPPRRTPDKDAFYMGMAFMMTAKSPDLYSQHGCYILHSSGRPIAMSENRPAEGYIQSAIDWSDSRKYMLPPIRAALSLVQRPRDLKEATIYTTCIPLHAEINQVVDFKCKEIIYYHAEYGEQKISIDSLKDLCKAGGVKMHRFEGNLNWMRDHMKRNHHIF